MTAYCPLLSHLSDVIASWERAESIRVFHVWISDSGDWQIEWTEETREKGPDLLRGGLFRGGETHSKVSRLLTDLRAALRDHGIDATHIARPGPDSLRAWTVAGQFLWWNAWVEATASVPPLATEKKRSEMGGGGGQCPPLPLPPLYDHNRPNGPFRSGRKSRSPTRAPASSTTILSCSSVRRSGS